jgi:hypothetical protein
MRVINLVGKILGTTAAGVLSVIAADCFRNHGAQSMRMSQAESRTVSGIGFVLISLAIWK